MLRCAVLELAAAGDFECDAGALGLCCALARQCFLNEYVFSCARGELEQAQSVRDSLTRAIEAGEAIPELWLAVVAAYYPLHSLPIATTLATRPWSEPVTALVIQQVAEPLEERQIRDLISVLTPIENGVSQLVRQQYEEYPYPRWLKAEPAGSAVTIVQFFRGKFPSCDLRALAERKEIDVLVAGCGTGQHPIESAQRSREARVLAIDLSLASLSFAQRKVRALALNNIEFAQADILKLPMIGRTFDVIEAGGVLHHLADSFEGWRVLLSLLRPGGLMAVGLYSERGRAEIAAAHAFIAERGYHPTAEDIRRCRQDLLALAPAAVARRLLNSVDFFSTSGARDLLFHVQEHRTTLLQIGTFLAENSVKLVGFELDAAVEARYRARFPTDRAMTDLTCWDLFESENPATFTRMYQFWVQKNPA